MARIKTAEVQIIIQPEEAKTLAKRLIEIQGMGRGMLITVWPDGMIDIAGLDE